jgi:putative methyltransferase (TIGR04325 family)
MKQDVVTTLRSAPVIGSLLRWRYKRVWSTPRGADTWFGEYPSFAAASAAAPRGSSLGYDQPSTTELYEHLADRINDTDYPVLFWLARTVDATSHLFDLGGHSGFKYYAYRRYLPVMPRRWTVSDVPAVVAAGAERARERGETALQFTSEPRDANGVDVLVTQGTLQYIETPFAAIIGGLARKPRHIIINKTPMAPEREYITLQNIGVTYCPYRIAREGDLAESLVGVGYELVDTWENASDFRKELPFTRATRVRWFGHYLRLRD